MLTALVIAHFHRGISFLSSMGEYSYSFYLMHWPVISALMYCMGGAVNTLWGSVTAFVFIPILSLVVSRWFYQITEKPALRWAKKIRYKN
jgi:peptidoglycan/LPS O-acetylase OafA/YrhL